MQGNVYVTYLNRYTTVSSEHEAAFDEFITQIPPPSGEPLRLETKTEQFLRQRFSNPNPPSIILTGNAGDGKTYLCRQVINSFAGQTITDWETTTDYPIHYDNLTLRVVKDLSEMDEESGAKILAELAQELQIEHSTTIFLIAANEGRLRAVMQKVNSVLYQEVDRQLESGPDLENKQLIILNLNRATTSAYVPQALTWLTDPVHWQACQGCPAFNACPIRFNASRLADDHISHRLTLLYQILERLTLHVTIRDMLIHLAYTLTCGLDCEAVIRESQDLGWEPQRYVYYENVWGQQADDIFQRKILVIYHLRHLNVGEDSLFELDDFIINGEPEDKIRQAQHKTLFAPALDLGGRRFQQDRDAYLRGGASSPKPEMDHPLIGWLPQIRRKLFFEWENIEQANRLFAFRFLPDYFHLLEGEQSSLRHFQEELILGLNRAFSGLYITDNQNLYITSQYARTVEQPVPIVRLEIPAQNLDLQVNKGASDAFEQNEAELLLEIFPPPRVQADPIKWPVDLLRFEYLMRRARGGTPDILANECELSIRQLKDDLLAHFVLQSFSEEKQEIKFFAADRNRYHLQTIWIDNDNIRI